jgi:hypothetical protein
MYMFYLPITEADMKYIRTVLFSAVLVLGVCTANAGDTMTEGEKLERKMWTMIMAGNMAAIESMIAPGFQSVHGDGARDRDAEIALLKGLDPLKVQFSDFKVTEQGDTVIVTYSVSVAETIDGQSLTNPTPAPRQSVWIKTPSGWQWIAHANLNPMTK